MDHAGQGVDVDAPRDDVGRHEGVGLALGKRIESPLPLPLGAVAVHGNSPYPLRLQLADDPVGAALGAAEDERLPVVLRSAWR